MGRNDPHLSHRHKEIACPKKAGVLKGPGATLPGQQSNREAENSSCWREPCYSPVSRRWRGPRQAYGSGGPAFLRKPSGSWSTLQGYPSSDPQGGKRQSEHSLMSTSLTRQSAIGSTSTRGRLGVGLCFPNPFLPVLTSADPEQAPEQGPNPRFVRARGL